MKLMVLDGNSIVNRAFYGIRMLTAPDGTPTNGIYGFLAILRKLLDEQRPEALCVTFDLPAPTFRHERFDGYKAQRKGMPDELAVQVPVLKDVLDKMGIARCELEGYEADDLIGTICRVSELNGWDCTIVTGDKDSFQLITDKTHVLHVKSRMGQTETIEYDPARFADEYGFEPGKMIDLKALMGDSSDNIPGVPGVGEKTALDLIRRFGSLEDIYASLDAIDIKDGVRRKLKEGEGSARMSYELASICTNAPVEFSTDGAVWDNDYKDGLLELFERLGFSRFIDKWGITGESESRSGSAPAGPEAEELGEGEALARLEALGPGELALYCDGTGKVQLYDGSSLISVECGDGGAPLFLERVASSGGKIVSHNVKDLLRDLPKEAWDAFSFDTALAAYLLDPTESGYELRRLTAKHLGAELDGARAIYSLRPVLDEKLRESGMDRLLYDVEMPLCSVLADMERQGCLVDVNALKAFGDWLNIGIDGLQRSIWDMAGSRFNINSTRQLGEVLFDKLMLPHGKKTKTGWSTNADVLEKLRGMHPIIEAVLDYRQMTKLKSTYVDGLLKVIEDDGRIHTSFQMTVTATGRLSSVEPNLQNIPVRSELGGEFRKMFLSPPGNMLVDADYSQIELRLLAHISGDETMQEAFLSGEDIHAVTASQVFGVPLREVTPLQRGRAKAVNFGIVYGISDFSLAQDIGVTRSEAKAYMDSYLAKYHGVREYMKSIVETAKKDGYVETLFGRRRPLPEIKSANYNIRSFGERVALNMPIQGTAADIMKIAMVRIYRRFESEGLAARLILQVHDELIAECPESEAGRVASILKEEMEGSAELSIPLTADAHYGRSWHEAK